MFSRYLLAGTGVCCALFSTVFACVPAAAQGLTGVVRNRLLVRFQENISEDNITALTASLKVQRVGTIAGTGVQILQLPEQADEIAIARILILQDEVDFVEPDGIYTPDATPNDSLYASQWHLPKIACPTAWDSTIGSTSVIVAILDTGCDPTHPDLSPKYVAGWNMYDNNSNTADVFGHGTAVAGTAAAAANNLSGVASVAWNCRIMPMRISDTAGYGYASKVASALTWAADHGARVANLSYAMSDSSTVASAAQYFQSKGGVVTMSAGNDGATLTAADNPYVLTVSATEATDTLATWSNRGSLIDVAAPGSGIMTTNNGGGYASWSGTSFSAPIVAGVAALVISARSSLSGVQVSDIIKQSADDLGTTGWDGNFGWGRVNASRAVTLALSTNGSLDSAAPTVTFLSPANGATVAGATSVQVSASDTGGIASLTLLLDGVQVASTTGASIAWSWNTQNSANGSHTLTAVATDPTGNAGSTSIAVSVANVQDSIAPGVTITSPTSGSTFSTALNITASASDNVAVTKVEFYVNGTFQLSATIAPYTARFNTRKWARGTYTLTCKAYDAAGNVTTSQPVTVTK